MVYSNFGNAPTEQGGMGEVVPEGTLAWAILKVRPFNLDQGLVLTPSKSTEGNAYLDVELTLIDGQYERRKVWTMIGLQGSEKYVQMGMAAVRHILEVGREIQGFAATDPKYRLGVSTGAQGDMVLMELNELRCAVKIGVEKGEGSYPDKNKIRAYLSPNPASDTFKTFMRLVSGDTAPTEKPKPAAAAATPSWSSGGQQAKPAAAAQPQGRPSWAGGPPPGHPAA